MSEWLILVKDVNIKPFLKAYDEAEKFETDITDRSTQGIKSKQYTIVTEALKPLNITAYRLSKELHIPQTRISQILHSKRSITADTAIRLSRFFGNSAKFWMGLQEDYDLEEVLRNRKQEYDEIEALAS